MFSISLRIATVLFLLIGCKATPQIEYDASRFADRKEGDLALEKFEFRDLPAERGKLVVRENRTDPNSNLIEVAFVRLLSPAQSKQSPVIYLAGTGGSGIKEGGGRFWFDFFKSLVTQRDVILLDYRGLGSSYPKLICTDKVTLPFDKPLERAAALQAFTQVLKSASDKWRAQGVDVYAYNTYEIAADIKVLLASLKEEKATLIGSSYGTHVALQFLKRFPDSVHRVVLHGTEGPDHTYKLPSITQRSLERIEKAVRADGNLGGKIESLSALLNRVQTKLEQPAVVKFKHPRSRREMKITLGQFDLLLAVKMGLKHRPRIDELPLNLYRVDQGDLTGLATLSVRMRKIAPPSLVPFIADCASGCSTERSAQIEDEKKRFTMQDFYNFPMPDICERLDVPDLGPDFRTNPESDKPVLFIHNSLDMHTPIENVQELLTGLSNAQILTVENDGHSPYSFSRPDFQDIVIEYIGSGKLKQKSYAFPRIRFKK